MARALSAQGRPVADLLGEHRPSARAPTRPVRAVVLAARPRQWIKNLLVVAAPGAAGVLGHGTELGRTATAFALFCLVASGTYLLNDALDVRADRDHPTKRLRPVASGAVPAGAAVALGTGMAAAATALAYLFLGWKFGTVVAVYLAITTAYSLRLKHEPVIELACISSGFILRAIGGGVATGVALSDWFLIVTSFGALFVVAGKRSAEQTALGDDRARHRRTLGIYPPPFLRSVRLLAAAVTVTAYCLWAFQRAAVLSRGHHPIWFELSITPFVLAVLHLELRFESGHGAAPEDLALKDRSLQVLALLGLALFTLGVYW